MKDFNHSTLLYRTIVIYVVFQNKDINALYTTPLLHIISALPMVPYLAFSTTPETLNILWMNILEYYT